MPNTAPSAAKTSRRKQQRADLPLIAAYGMFWERDQHDFEAGRGSTFQMIGIRGDNAQWLQVCDFRKARGVYVLYNDHGPTYVGRARGREGFGVRFRSHAKDSQKIWNRFCWYSFDPIAPWPDRKKWWCSVANDGSGAVSSEKAIDGLEALMINAFGLRGQNQMKLADGKPWRQATYVDGVPGGLLRAADPRPIRDTDLRDALAIKTLPY